METVFRFLCFSADLLLLLRQDIKQILKMIRLRHYLHFVNSSSCSYVRLLLKPFSSQRSHLEDVGPMASMLKSRAVIRFRGPDTVKFLQGLVTNDVRSFCEPVGQKSSNFPMPNVPAASVPPVYAALLTPQGRFLFDLFLYRPPQPDQKFDRTGSGPGPKPDVLELFADVDASVLDELMATFIKYRLRSNVDIESVTEEFSCWQRFGGNLAKKSSVEEPEAAGVGYGGAVDHSGMSATQGNGPGWHWYKDPRLECLGHRGIFASGTTPPLVEADKMTDEENYLLWRMDKGVAEGSTEIPKREAIPLEYNFDGLNAISFNKGCYVGQELIARTHHRGNIRKRLLPLKFLDDGGQELGQKVVPGSEVVDAASKKKAGTVTTAIGSRGLGLLRLDETFRGKGPLTIKGQEDVKVEAIRPEWWPAEWLQDHQQIKASA